MYIIKRMKTEVVAFNSPYRLPRLPITIIKRTKTMVRDQPDIFMTYISVNLGTALIKAQLIINIL